MVLPKQVSKREQLCDRIRNIALMLRCELVREALEANSMSLVVSTRRAIGGNGFESLLRVQIVQRYGSKSLYAKEYLLDAEIKALADGQLEIWEPRVMQFADVIPANFIQRVSRILGIKDQAHELEMMSVKLAHLVDYAETYQLLDAFDELNSCGWGLRSSRVTSCLSEVDRKLLLRFEIARYVELFGRTEVVWARESYELSPGADGCLLLNGGAGGSASQCLQVDEFHNWIIKQRLS